MKRKVAGNSHTRALLLACAANAAEMYNKNDNKVDLYGKVDARHTFSDNPGDDGDETYVQVGFQRRNADHERPDRLWPVGI